MNRNKLRIRVAREKDLPEMLSLIRGYERYDEKYARRYYKKYFADDEIVCEDEVFVGEMGGQIVGVAGYCRDYFSTDYSYWLGWFVVGEEFRGQNKGFVGKKLLEKVENDLKKRGVSRLFVSTDDKNGRAINFYIKHNFRFEARLRDYYYQGDDQIILSKSLG